MFFGLSFFIFWWMTFQHGRWVYALIYVWVGMAGAMAPSMGWTVANYLLTAREARRVFGFIGAGQVLGAPVAGFFTAAATRHVRPEALVPVIGLSMMLCAALIWILFRRPRPQMVEVSRPRAAPDIPKNFRQIVLHILRTRSYDLLVGISEERHARSGARRTAHVFAEHSIASAYIGSVRKTPSLVTALVGTPQSRKPLIRKRARTP